MSRRKSEDRSNPEAAPHKPPVRVPRRQRRRPAGVKTHPPQGAGKAQPNENAPEPYLASGPDHNTLKLSRVPRAVEPPPANPNIFSYTFTIWKDT